MYFLAHRNTHRLLLFALLVDLCRRCADEVIVPLVLKLVQSLATLMLGVNVIEHEFSLITAETL